MWRYLILNSLWFALLFFVNFFGSVRSRLIVLIGLIAAAVCLPAVVGGVDPFVWAYYLTASFLVLWGAHRFKLWSRSRSAALDEELNMLTRRFDTEAARLARKSADTAMIAQQAGKITYLCEKIKQMSQCLDGRETFLVFGEALKNIAFDKIKLVLTMDADQPERVLGVSHSDFEGVFDRSAFLKDASRLKDELSDFEKKMLAELVERGKPLIGSPTAAQAAADSPLIAYPANLNRKMFAALFIAGVGEKDRPIVAILAESFIAEMQRLKLYEHVETLALTDGVTGVSVRRHLLQRLDEELGRSKRLGLKLSFLMIDIDDFKRVNDEHGHLVGDVVLKGVAGTIRKNIREVDLVGRYGGEEFGVFLIETDESGAFFVAERIRHAVAGRSYRAYHEDLRLSISVGCSTYAGGDMTFEQLIENADAALYEAKRQGKNRVQMAGIGEEKTKDHA